MQLLQNVNQSIQEIQDDNSSIELHDEHATDLNKTKEQSPLLPAINIETKQQGTVKLGVYITYLKAGIGVICGSVLIIFIFSVHQAIAVASNLWLALWSTDENTRYRVISVCINSTLQKSKQIYEMADHEWNAYRNQQYISYCGL